jgi:hypothetical protein
VEKFLSTFGGLILFFFVDAQNHAKNKEIPNLPNAFWLHPILSV